LVKTSCGVPSEGRSDDQQRSGAQQTTQAFHKEISLFYSLPQISRGLGDRGVRPLVPTKKPWQETEKPRDSNRREPTCKFPLSISVRWYPEQTIVTRLRLE